LAERAGIPVVATCAAAVAAFHALGIDRIALFDPPWFDVELDRLGAEYFRAQGLEVVVHSPCGLPSNQRSINPSDLFAWAVEHMPAGADAVFIGGNGFRAVGVIAALEEDLRRPVVTANSSLLWGLLQAAHCAARPTAYGQLFAMRYGT
jgi:maleate isomerase